MTLRELLDLVVAALEAEGIEYMVTGSVASSLYGEPRATNDVDIVIDPSPAALERLVDRLHARKLYVDLGAAKTALAERSQFNALVLDTKVDFIIRKDTEFSAVAFGRRGRVHGSEIQAEVVSAEDLILSKLVWAAETDSERQLRDVAGVVALAQHLDREYIGRWAARLRVLDAWLEIERGASAD